MVCLHCVTACVSAASSDWWTVCYTPYSLSKDTRKPACKQWAMQEFHVSRSTFQTCQTSFCKMLWHKTSMHTQLNTDPAALSVHVHAADVFGQVRAGVEQHVALIPAAGVRWALSGGGRRHPAVPVHQRWGWTTAGCNALHVHESAADTETHRNNDFVQRKPNLIQKSIKFRGAPMCVHVF